MEAGALVREGDTVIFDINGDRQAIVVVDGKKEVKVGKAFCAVKPLIGCPYGSLFTLGADGKSLERTAYVPLKDWDLPTPDVAPDFNTRTNADLVDGGTSNQALSAADIQAMKEEGRAGADIVAALTANSATFATKTEFSQEKYKKKKAKKYIQVGTVRRPTAAAICEAYFANSPAKTGYLRVDALALLLNLANVGAHARVLVVETCGGLVTAAVAERLGGYGGVCSAWVGGAGTRKPSLDIWRHMNLSQHQQAVLRFAPLQTLLSERQQQQQAEAEAGAQQGSAQPQNQDVQQPAEALATSAASAEAKPLADQQQGAPPAAAAVQQGAEASHAASSQQPPFNSCILAASNVSPLALLRGVLPLLAPSASFAVFSPWQHPLAEALDALRGQGQVTNLALQETWWRDMQVLPLRTHPNMNMNHGGGYILTGTVLAA